MEKVESLENCGPNLGDSRDLELKVLIQILWKTLEVQVLGNSTR